MSIKIIKHGLLDTIQDHGRYGYQQLGIPPGGVMDHAAFYIVNALVGNNPNASVIEMHFPAAYIQFEKPALIAISGGNFSAEINGYPLSINKPVWVSENSLLKFNANSSGSRIYLGIYGGWQANRWLNSMSTNLAIQGGGYYGRPLKKGDQIRFQKNQVSIKIKENHLPFFAFPWNINTTSLYESGKLPIIIGHEYPYLLPLAKQKLIDGNFIIEQQSNRMGYRLVSEPLYGEFSRPLISTAVTRGTIQLLPNGQLIILMSDHQTTGGYPRIGHIASAAMDSLAQKKNGSEISFHLIDQLEAEENYLLHQRSLQQIAFAARSRLSLYLSEINVSL